MAEEEKLVPVLQLSDLEALQAAAKHLGEQGFVARVAPFSELPAAEHQSWMTPANGGYLLYLGTARYNEGMSALGKFFGCTE